MALFDDTRADWGARNPQAPIYTVPISTRTEKFAHWNGGPLHLSGQPHSACLAAVRAIQAEHMHNDPSHNWADIGYNALVCPAHARAIEGRGRDAVGAHCPNHNRTGIAVQFMLGKGEQITPAMFARAAQFFADCEKAAGHHLHPMGHRDGFSTECPGDQAEAWVKAGMPGATAAAPTPTKDWFDMATQADLKAVLLDPDVARNIAKFVASGFAWKGPDGKDRVLAGHLSVLDGLSRVAIKAATEDLTTAQVQQAVADALAANYDVTLTATPKGA